MGWILLDDVGCSCSIKSPTSEAVCAMLYLLAMASIEAAGAVVARILRVCGIGSW